jgi:hypothetical protein
MILHFKNTKSLNSSQKIGGYRGGYRAAIGRLSGGYRVAVVQHAPASCPVVGTHRMHKPRQLFFRFSGSLSCLVCVLN